jgi:hypothetical protein
MLLHNGMNGDDMLVADRSGRTRLADEPLPGGAARG